LFWCASAVQLVRQGGEFYCQTESDSRVTEGISYVMFRGSFPSISSPFLKDILPMFQAVCRESYWVLYSPYGTEFEFYIGSYRSIDKAMLKIASVYFRNPSARLTIEVRPIL